MVSTGARDRLDRLVGLADVKQQIANVLNQWEYQKIVTERGIRVGLGPNNMTFVGPPGTGKTTVARLYAQVCSEAGFSRVRLAHEVSRVNLIGDHTGSTAQRTTKEFEEALGGVLFIDDAPSLTPVDSPGDPGFEVVDTLVKLLDEYRHQLIVVAAGDDVGMRRFLDSRPGMRQRFPRTVTFGNFTPTELSQIVEQIARRDGFQLAPDVHQQLVMFFVDRAPWAANGNAWAARQVFETMRDALVRRSVQTSPAVETDLVTLKTFDLDRGLGQSALTMGRGKPDRQQIDALLSRIDELPGLADAKQAVKRLIALSQVAVQRQAVGLPADLIVGSMVLSGPPGTGKTLIARFIGQLLAAVGVLTQGQMVEVSRVDMVGKWIGHSAQLTKDVFNRARGGVLFIDEAYALAPPDSPRDFGFEVVSTLVKLMDDHWDDTIVMVAGYSEDIERFLDSNPGLRGRFSNTITFAGYEHADLARIVEIMAQERRYELTPAARILLAERYRLLLGEGLGDARHARRVLELTVQAQTERLSQRDSSSVQELVTLTHGDLPGRLPPLR